MSERSKALFGSQVAECSLLILLREIVHPVFFCTSLIKAHSIYHLLLHAIGSLSFFNIINYAVHSKCCLPPRILMTVLFHAHTAPKLIIIDELGDPLQDKYYEVDSTIKLSCIIRDVMMPSAVVFWNHSDQILNYDTSRGGIRYVSSCSSFYSNAESCNLRFSVSLGVFTSMMMQRED